MQDFPPPQLAPKHVGKEVIPCSIEKLHEQKYRNGMDIVVLSQGYEGIHGWYGIVLSHGHECLKGWNRYSMA